MLETRSRAGSSGGEGPSDMAIDGRNPLAGLHEGGELTLTVDQDAAAEGDELPMLVPEDIDESFAPAPAQSVVSSRFADELLLVDKSTGRIHVLNAVGAVVWECFDGKVTLGQLALELSEAYKAPLDRVRQDVLTVARQLGQLGLLDRVGQLMPEPPPIPGRLDVGQQIEPFAALTDNGDSVTVPRPGRKGTLLVNWSPTCGYCIKIIDDLARCQPGLADRDIDLVLLSVGSAESNRPLLESAGLADSLLYHRPSDHSDAEEAADPFGRFGTPVAYLLDGDGRIEQPLALGAVDVPELARQAAGFPAVAAGEPPASQRRILPVAGGMCGPSAGGSGKEPRVWAGTSAYAVGDYQIGIRADSERTRDVLSRVFGRYRVNEDTSVRDNFSVVLGGNNGGVAQALSLLLAGNDTVVRSRSPRRVVYALRAHLSALARDETHGLFETTNVAALIGDRAVLLPPVVLGWMDYLQPRLARLGVGLSDEPHALVDPAQGVLVVPEPTIQIDADALAELREPARSRSELSPVQPGRYPLGIWTFAEDPSRSGLEVTRASAVAALLAVVVGSPDELGELITAVGRVLDSAAAVPLRCSSPRELMASLEERVILASSQAR
jgi:hypothetical protein